MIFLEFGKLSLVRGVSGKTTGPFGELSLMSVWKWKIDSGRSTLALSWGNERRWSQSLKRLVGAKVRSVKILTCRPDLEILLSNGLRVTSPAGDRFSGWTVLGHQAYRGSVSVRRGKLRRVGRGA